MKCSHEFWKIARYVSTHTILEPNVTFRCIVLHLKSVLRSSATLKTTRTSLLINIFCLYQLQAVNSCESKLQSSPQYQSDGATLLPLLEHPFEGAHQTLLDMHWRVHLSSFRYISKPGGEISNKLMLRKWLLYTPANARACIGGPLLNFIRHSKLSLSDSIVCR